MTRFQLHVHNNHDCDRCGLSLRRGKVVLARGQVPCDVLFIGEAPGESENAVGKPFVGPAGKLLDYVIAKSLGHRHTVAMTNMVCCIPYDDNNDKLAEPPDEAVWACSPRLLDFVELASPKLIVCVGAFARDWTDPQRRDSVKVGDIPRVDITHPAAVLRASVVQRGILIQRMVVTLTNATEEYLQ